MLALVIDNKHHDLINRAYVRYVRLHCRGVYRQTHGGGDPVPPDRFAGDKTGFLAWVEEWDRLDSFKVVK